MRVPVSKFPIEIMLPVAIGPDGATAKLAGRGGLQTSSAAAVSVDTRNIDAAADSGGAFN